MKHGTCITLMFGRRLAVVEHKRGYTLAGLFGNDVEIGDELEGDWEVERLAGVHNRTRNRSFQMSLQGVWPTQTAALRATAELVIRN